MKNLINEHNELLEMQFIAHLAVHEKFVDIPETLLYTTKCQNVYKAWKRQYLATGSFNTLIVPEGAESLLSECFELSTGVKPDSLIVDLRKYYNVREFFKICVREMENVGADLDVVKQSLNNVSKMSTDLLMESEVSQDYSHGESVSQFIEDVHDAAKSGREFRGYKSHLPELDGHISGWELGKVYLISGLEKLGKSRFVRNLFSTWLKVDYGCCMFLLEEDAESIHECILADRAAVNTSAIGTSGITSHALKKLRDESMAYMNQPLYISTKSGINTQYVKSTIQRQKIKMRAKGKELMFCVIDYVQRMTESGNGKHEQTENIASELANIARDENICMIEISQMGSGAEKNKTIPLHTQIRFGKVFKEAAHCIITFDDPERMQKNGKTESMDVSTEEAESKTIVAHIIQRKGISDINVFLRAQLQYSSFACQSNRF